MADTRIKFVRKARNGDGWEYGYTQAEIRIKDRQVVDQVVGRASTMQDAAAVWLDPRRPGSA